MAAFTFTGTVAPWGEEGTLQHDEMGRPVIKIMTCGTCGRSWNDALITGRTPVPSARCPFEYDHDDPDEGDDLYRAGLALERAEDAVTDATEAGAPRAVIMALTGGRDYVWGEYHLASQAAAHEREHAAMRQVRALIAGLDEEG